MPSWHSLERLSKVNSTVSQQEVSAVTEIWYCSCCWPTCYITGRCWVTSSSPVTAYSVLLRTLMKLRWRCFVRRISELGRHSAASRPRHELSNTILTYLVVLLTHWASPIDGLGAIHATHRRPIEFRLLARHAASACLQTGFRLVFCELTLWFLSAVVSVKLVIGDRKTGKTISQLTQS